MYLSEVNFLQSTTPSLPYEHPLAFMLNLSKYPSAADQFGIPVKGQG